MHYITRDNSFKMPATEYQQCYNTAKRTSSSASTKVDADVRTAYNQLMQRFYKVGVNQDTSMYYLDPENLRRELSLKTNQEYSKATSPVPHML